jgi:hypothetical protein
MPTLTERTHFSPGLFPDELAAQTYFWQNETAMRGALTPNDENICDIRRLLGFPSPRRKLLILQDRLIISGTSQFRPGPSPAARRQQVFLAERTQLDFRLFPERLSRNLCVERVKISVDEWRIGVESRMELL